MSQLEKTNEMDSLMELTDQELDEATGGSVVAKKGAKPMNYKKSVANNQVEKSKNIASKKSKKDATDGILLC